MNALFKSIVFAVLAAVFSAAPASSADIFERGNSDPTQNPYDYFRGFYLGASTGGQFTNIDVLNVFDGIGADGGVLQIQGGYDFALGGITRAGVYCESGLTNVNVEIGTVDALNQDNYIGCGVRAGVVIGHDLLAYGKAGYEWQDWSSDLFTGSIDIGAIALGGGIEAMINQNDSLGVDATYLMVNDAEVAGTDVTSFVNDSEALRVLARVNWRQ